MSKPVMIVFGDGDSRPLWLPHWYPYLPDHGIADPDDQGDVCRTFVAQLGDDMLKTLDYAIQDELIDRQENEESGRGRTSDWQWEVIRLPDNGCDPMMQ